MYKIIVMVAFISCLSLAIPVKEWKNFENGKVYSRKMTNDISEVVGNQEIESSPRVEERLLHSHHKDKNRKMSAEQQQQSVDPKQPSKVKQNAERHHKKVSVEEEMHLRPLNERHHKFPNPALLDKDGGTFQDSKISRHTFLQQVRRKQNKRRQRGGKRLKRNKADLKNQEGGITKTAEETMKVDNVAPEKKQVEVKPVISRNDDTQYTLTRKEIFPVKQTSYW